ncbi:MAG: BON domain-containing protein [Alphaproteobacteria bacterium]|nr:BON domain-containing protein [Alphaproteobacteria bacterium]
MPNTPNARVLRRPGRTATIALSALLAGAVLAGCSPVGVAVGAGAAGITATQKEKGFSQSVDDTRIRAQLNADFIANNVDLFGQISFTVEEGRVLLTGNVPTPDARVEAVRLAWGVAGVREVINEISVTDKSSLSDDSRDLWIATKLRGRLLVDDQVSSINYSIDVVNKTVYIMGVARSADELNRVLGHARQVSHVRRVVDHTRLIQAPAS